MNSHTIDLLTAYDPEAATPRGVTMSMVRSRAPGSLVHVEKSASFISRYCRAAFGWHIAKQYAKYRIKFPIPMQGRDMWVLRAYLMLVNPVEFFDIHIADAFHLNQMTRPSFSTDLKALIMSVKDTQTTDEHLNQMASMTGIHRDTLEAFEVLFFNFLDRREEGMILAKSIYPTTRLVEYDDAYFKSTPAGAILIRAGYNNKDTDLTGYLMGLSDSTYLSKLAASDNREVELAKHLASNGLLLSRLNLLNQPMVGLTRATTLMAAARQGGQQAEEPIMTGVGDEIMSQLAEVRRISQRNVVDMMREDARQALEAEVFS